MHDSDILGLKSPLFDAFQVVSARLGRVRLALAQLPAPLLELAPPALALAPLPPALPPA